MIFKIRRAKINDLHSVKSITQHAFKDYEKKACPEAARSALNETDEDLKNDIENKYVSLAFYENKAVGSLRIEIKDKTAYLSRFGVVSGYRSGGCGKQLLADAEKYLKEHGVKTLYLHTASKASSLMRFYYGSGFYVVSVDLSKGYIRVKMAKDICDK